MYYCLWRSSRILFASRENSVNTSKVLPFRFYCTVDARKCTIHFAIVHVYVLINCFSESKFEMSMDFWQWDLVSQ